MIANPPLGDERHVGTLRAFKAALITGDAESGVTFRGVGRGTSYGPADSAVCVTDAEHVPPHPGCGCGFYAWKDRDDAVGLVDDAVGALLEVELWGRFHEYEYGYVAAVQLVRRATLLPYCVRCLRSRDTRLRAACALGRAAGNHEVFAPLCDEHLTPGALGLCKLSDELGVEVGWADDGDAIVEAARQLVSTLRYRPPRVRHLDELVSGELAHVFQNAIAQDDAGRLFIDPVARLVQPLPGTDVPIRLAEDGTPEVLLDGLIDFDGWQTRSNSPRCTLRIRACGAPARGRDESAQPGAPMDG